MSPRIRIEIRQSEIRARVVELAEVETLDEAQQKELGEINAEYRQNEEKLQAILATADEDQPPEERELRSLERNFDVGELAHAVLENRAIEGRERDAQQALSLEADMFPISLLEERAIATVTGDVQTTQRDPIPQLFPAGVAAFLGVSTPRAAVGDVAYPVITGGASAADYAKSAAIAESTAAITVTTVEPRAFGAALRYAEVDALRLRGMSAALVANLRQALGAEHDEYIVRGPTKGLLTGTNLAKIPSTDPTGALTWQQWKERLALDRVDGLYATGPEALRVLVGPDTYAQMGKVYRGTAIDTDAIQEVQRLTGGFRVSAHMPATASNLQPALVARGRAMNAVAPVWAGVRLTTDRITRARNREVLLTATMYGNFQILRTDGFARVTGYIPS